MDMEDNLITIRATCIHSIMKRTSQRTLFDSWQKQSEKRRKASTDTTSFESGGDLADVSEAETV